MEKFIFKFGGKAIAGLAKKAWCSVVAKDTTVKHFSLNMIDRYDLFQLGFFVGFVEPYRRRLPATECLNKRTKSAMPWKD